MHPRHLQILMASILALSGIPSAAWPQATLIERSLEALAKSPPATPDCFDFVVVGDSNTLDPLEQSAVFRQCVKEFNILGPDFVVEVGDIILGGAAQGVPAQWDLFDEVIAGCNAPYLPLPGNHDISDAATERIWRERIGPTHYAFDHGNSRFILLNSEEVGALERISDTQVAWLRETLDSSTANNIFVFLHKPYFAPTRDPESADTRWKAHWANVAETFEGHPVRAVFAGHWHGYRDCGTREGVRYAITGGASVYGMHDGAEEGSFNHYLWLRVRGEEVNWAVIKPYAILPENAVTSNRIGELYNIRNRWIAAEEVFAPLGDSVAQDVTITIRNPHQGALESSLRWQTPPGWRVSPAETAYAIPAESAVDLAFHVETDTPEHTRFPVPAFQTSYAKTQYGPPVEVDQDLKLVPVLSARRTQGPITLDGVLDEWETAQMAPLPYPVAFDAKDTDDLECKLGFLWDDAHLYLAVETHDNEFHQPYAGDIVWKADNVEMFLDAWSWGLSLTKAGPEVFLYSGVDVESETVNSDVKLAVKRAGTKVVYEAAFPASVLTPLTLRPGNSFRFNAIMNDLDPSGPTEPRHWLELLPGAGSLGSRAPRAKVVLEE